MKAIWRDPAQVPADGDTMEAAGPGLAGEASRVPGSGSPPAGASGDPVGQLLLVAVSVYALAALAFDVLAGPPPAISRLIHHADLAVCTVFFVDFLRNLRAAPDKWRYMRTWGWLDLLSSIPMVDALRAGRLAYVVRILYLLRAARAARVITASLRDNRGRDAFAITAFLCFTLIVFGSATVLVVEAGPGASIRNAEQALWWAVVTLTTVGYGDLVPTTTAGRLVAGVLMISGVGLFGVLSGIVASWIVAPQRSQRARELEALRLEVERLSRLVEQSLTDGGADGTQRGSANLPASGAAASRACGAPPTVPPGASPDRGRGGGTG